jgi:hypothetical protein
MVNEHLEFRTQFVYVEQEWISARNRNSISYFFETRIDTEKYNRRPNKEIFLAP